MTASPPAPRHLEPPPHDFWVFAYGSLMWNPEFPYRSAVPARVLGYHRALCLYSTHYRGTAERPGLVLGLDRGGSCLGRAYRVAAVDGLQAAATLDRREMLGGVYDPRWVGVRFADGRRDRAYAYVVNRDNPHYAGRLDPEAAAALVLQGVGERGSCVDYLANTVGHMDQLGIADSALHDLLERVQRRLAATAESGG